MPKVTEHTPNPTDAHAHGPKVCMGRIVRYTPPARSGIRREYPALVSTAHSAESVNLYVFDEMDGNELDLQTSVSFDARGPDGPGGTWRWPPRN